MKPLPQMFAFTIKHAGLVKRVLTEILLCEAYDANDPPAVLPPQIQAIALWDTGATNSVITKATALALGLIPVGVGPVNHAGGTEQCATYLVNFTLPNHVTVQGILVYECADAEFGAIIGMDIISQGDFALTNHNGQTWLSFRVPSHNSIDYVVESHRIMYAGVKPNDPCPCGTKIDGRITKFKKCHGKL